MADVNKAITKLNTAGWVQKAENEAEANLRKVDRKPIAQAGQGSAPKAVGSNNQAELVRRAGEKAIAAAKKDQADVRALLLKLETIQENKNTSEAAQATASKPLLAQIIAIGRKHKLSDSTIKQELRGAQFDA